MNPETRKLELLILVDDGPYSYICMYINAAANNFMLQLYL